MNFAFIACVLCITCIIIANTAPTYDPKRPMEGKQTKKNLLRSYILLILEQNNELI